MFFCTFAFLLALKIVDSKVLCTGILVAFVKVYINISVNIGKEFAIQINQGKLVSCKS